MYMKPVPYNAVIIFIFFVIHKARCFGDNMYGYGPSQNDKEINPALYELCHKIEIPGIQFDFYGQKQKEFAVSSQYFDR